MMHAAPYSKTYVIDYSSGQSVDVSLNTLLKKGSRGAFIVSHIECRLDLVLTSAATSDAVTGRRMVEAIDRFTFGGDKSNVGIQNLSGFAMRQLQTPLTGRAPRDPADLAANSNATNNKTFRWVMPFADKRAANPGEQGIPAGYLSKGNIRTTWATNSFFGTGQTIATTTKLYVTIYYFEMEDDEKVASTRVLYRQKSLEKFEGQVLEAGTLTDLVLAFKNGGTELASDDFTTIGIKVDEAQLCNNEDLDKRVDAFNAQMIADAAAYINAPEDSASSVVESVPILWPGRDGYKLTKLPQAHQTYTFDIGQGSAPPTVTDLIFIERRIVDRTNEGIIDMLVGQGANEAILRAVLAVLPGQSKDVQLAVLRPKTISKVPITGPKSERMAAILPARYDEDAAKALLAGMSKTA